MAGGLAAALVVGAWAAFVGAWAALVGGAATALVGGAAATLVGGTAAALLAALGCTKALGCSHTKLGSATFQHTVPDAQGVRQTTSLTGTGCGAPRSGATQTLHVNERMQ